MLSLVILTVVTVSFGFLRNRKAEAAADKNIFNNFDVRSIDQVRLESSRGVVNLKYDGSRWMVNEAYPADPAMIEVLFATTLQAVPKRPVPAQWQDSIANVLKTDGTVVTMHSGGETEVSFSAGGNAAKTQAWFLRSDQQVPYVMQIPGYRVYVSGIFELNESGWRDKRIFAFNWRLNFKDLETTYARNKDDNFRVELRDQLLTVQGLNEVDSARLNQYLNDVSQLAADEFVEANKPLDSLARTAPVMVLTVHDVGRTYQLQLFPYTDSQGRVAGLVGGSQWAMFNRRAVTSISRPRRFFEPKP